MNVAISVASETIIVLHPAAEHTVQHQPAAPRLATLRGMTIALIDNHKRNADVYLDELEQLLRERHEVADVITYRKVSMSMPTPEEVLNDLRQACDALIHAVAD